MKPDIVHHLWERSRGAVLHLEDDRAAAGSAGQGGPKCIGAGQAGKDAGDGHPIAAIEGF